MPFIYIHNLHSKNNSYKYLENDRLWRYQLVDEYEALADPFETIIVNTQKHHSLCVSI